MNILYPILLIILIVLLILSAILIANSSFLLSYNDKKLIKKGGAISISDLMSRDYSMVDTYLQSCLDEGGQFNGFTITEGAPSSEKINLFHIFHCINLFLIYQVPLLIKASKL